MDRRRSPRVGAHLPVRVWGVDAHDLPFMQLASVKNLSSTGAVIHGMRRQMRPGEILEVQMDNEKGAIPGDLDRNARYQFCRRDRFTEARFRTMHLDRRAGLLQRNGGAGVVFNIFSIQPSTF